MSKTEKTESTEMTPAVSSQRQIVATVATAGTAVVLGIVANILVGKVSTRVHDAIIPPANTNDNESK
jgi:hypothetical protein